MTNGLKPQSSPDSGQMSARGGVTTCSSRPLDDTQRTPHATPPTVTCTDASVKRTPPSGYQNVSSATNVT